MRALHILCMQDEVWQSLRPVRVAQGRAGAYVSVRGYTRIE